MWTEAPPPFFFESSSVLHIMPTYSDSVQELQGKYRKLQILFFNVK